MNKIGENPSISVCIPTHNRPDYLKRAISSVLASTRQNFEIIVSDDSLDKATFQVVESFHDKRIRYVKCHAQDIAANWSNALRHGQASYLFKLDDDDEIESTFLEKCCDFLDTHPDVSIVFTGFTFHKPGQLPVEHIDRTYFRAGIVDGFCYARDILLNEAYPQNHKSAGVFRRKCAEQIDFFDRVTVDILFTVAIASTGNVGYIPEPLFRYIATGSEHEGMGKRPLQMFFESVHRFFEIPNIQSQPSWVALKKKSVRNMTKGGAIRYIANAFFVSGWSHGWEMARFALKHEPTLKRSLFFWFSVLLFSIFPRKFYNDFIITYINTGWIKRIATNLMHT